MSGPLVVRVEKEKLNNVAKVASVASLIDVTLKKLQVANNLPSLSQETQFSCDVRFMHRLESFEISDQNILKASTEARVEYFKDPDDRVSNAPVSEDKLFVLLTVIYTASYKLPDNEIPEDIIKDCIPLFAEFNGLYNCWPYLREKIQSLTSEMGVKYILPTLNIIGQEETKEQKKKTTVPKVKKSASPTKKPTKKKER